MSHPRYKAAAAAAANSSRKSNGISIQKSPQSDDQLLRRARKDRQRHPYEIVDPGDGRRDDYRGSSDRQERTLRPSSAAAVLAEDRGQEAQRQSVVRRKNFRHIEKVNGKMVNVLQGLELHTGVFSAEDQKRIVNCVYDLQEKGRRGMLKERTYSEPRKWMRGKGRVTIQFGCCYNYATDKHGNPPGIIRDEYVDPIPPLLKEMIKRMVAWQVLPQTCVPNSCIVNIYDEDDCIPPHIDHHDFLRPFCTVSFLSECNILFGTELKVLGPGEFSGSSAIPLPLGSVLILNGNGADVAKHCVPAVPSKRISITFRKMDESKMPYEFVPDPDLQNLQAITLARPPPTPPSSVVLGQNERRTTWPVQQQDSQLSRGSQNHKQEEGQSLKDGEKKASVFSPPPRSPFQLQTEDFPPLGSAGHANKRPTRPIRQ